MIVRAKLWRVVRVVWERGASACFGAASSGTSKYADKLLGDLGMDVRKPLRDFGLRCGNPLFAFVPLLLAFVDLGGRDTQDPLEVVEGSETRACGCVHSDDHRQKMQAGSSMAGWELA